MQANTTSKAEALIKSVDSPLILRTVVEYTTAYQMAKHPGWVSVQQAEELLGIDKKTLFKYRDDGTLKLGPHYAAFPETRSRDGFLWNVHAVRKQLQKLDCFAVV